jgi:phosphatidyl-myo-inositol dimannoside synthase
MPGAHAPTAAGRLMGARRPFGSPRVLFAATSLAPGAGGIQRVGRMAARVLREILPADGELRALVLGDRGLPPDILLSGTATGGSRVRFGLVALTASCTHLVTDAINLGQIQWLPNLCRKPLLTFMHGIEIWENAKPRWVRSARGAAVPVFVSEFSREKAERIHGPFPAARVCPLATEADDPLSPRPVSIGVPEILIVGRLMNDRPKGHRELILAWPTVMTKVPEAVLRIVGCGPGEAELKSLAGQSTATSQVRFEGFVSDARLDELYARATAFAMPSRGEGFGLVYIEAMRHSLPVIASVHDAGRELVEDGRTGFLVDLDRPGQLADRLVAVLEDPALARSMGAAGQEKWARDYTFSRFRARLEPIVSEFLSR